MATIRDRYVLDIDTRGATNALGTLSTAVKGFVAVLAVDQVRQFGQAIIDATAQFQNYENQLRLITNSQEELETLLGRLTNAAQQNRAAFGDTVDLFTKLTLATADLNIEQERILAVTQRFQQALAISGADAGTAAGAIRQFGQAMASGTVRGDEFNSIVEALGPALAIMAQESGLTVGKLRQMSQAGELTAETFFEMIEASNALGEAFNKTEPAIDNLETALADAFDRALVKIGEVTGATTLYEESLKSLTNTFDRLAGTEVAPVNMTAEQLENFAANGITAEQALAELQRRLEALPGSLEQSMQMIDDNFFSDIFGVQSENERILAAFRAVTAAIREQQAATEEIQAQTEALNTQRQALDAILEPHQKFIDQAQKFADTDYRTELEKANQRVIDAEIVIEQLHLAFERTNGQVDNFIFLLRGAENELEAAKARVAELTEETKELAEVDAFTKFYNSLIENANDAVQEIEFTLLAIERLKDELDSGRISIDTYAMAMNALGIEFGQAKEEADELQRQLEELTDATDQSIAAIDARIARSQEQAELSGLQGLQRDLKAIELEELRLAEVAKERIRAQTEGLDASEIERQMQRIDEAAQQAIRSRQDAARTINANEERFRQIEEQRREEQKKQEEAAKNAQRTFAEGWKKAYEDYAKNATDAGKQAERIFNRTTRSIEDSIVNFAKTGKFEFKDLISTILEELLRSQIQRLIAQTFGVFGSGGGAGNNSLFGGFFANGGFLPSGKFGIVGENGPELITGPGNITPLDNFGGGMGAVTYNINAVDASSFKQMVARDPGFIHAVAQQGARKIPTRR